jgi:hypothetical protein
VKNFFSIVSWFVSTAFTTFVLLAGASYFYGQTKITAKFAGTNLEGAAVFLDGYNVGLTPYKAWLMPGSHDLRVVPPESYETMQAEYKGYIVSTIRGGELMVEFDPRP